MFTSCFGLQKNDFEDDEEFVKRDTKNFLYEKVILQELIESAKVVFVEKKYEGSVEIDFSVGLYSSGVKVDFKNKEVLSIQTDTVVDRPEEKHLAKSFSFLLRLMGGSTSGNNSNKANKNPTDIYEIEEDYSASESEMSAQSARDLAHLIQKSNATITTIFDDLVKKSSLWQSIDYVDSCSLSNCSTTVMKHFKVTIKIMVTVNSLLGHIRSSIDKDSVQIISNGKLVSASKKSSTKTPILVNAGLSAALPPTPPGSVRGNISRSSSVSSQNGQNPRPNSGNYHPSMTPKLSMKDSFFQAPVVEGEEGDEIHDI